MSLLIHHPNVQGYWRFQGNGNDEKGVNNLTAGATTSYTTGVTGSAGVGASNSTGYFYKDSGVSGIGGVSNFTAFIRVKRNATGTIHYVFGAGNTALYAYFVMQITAANKIYWEVGNAANTASRYITTNETIADTNWHNIALTYDGTNVGVVVDGTAFTGTQGGTGSGTMYSPTTYLRACTYGTTAMGYGVTIDELAFLSLKLTADEIKRIGLGYAPLRRV